MNSDPTIRLPLFVLREVLSKGGRKCKTATGKDGIGWSALSSLPPCSVLILRDLFAKRLKGETDHCGTLTTWCDILVTLIPKSRAPDSVDHWRPISLTSNLQKYTWAVL